MTDATSMATNVVNVSSDRISIYATAGGDYMTTTVTTDDAENITDIFSITTASTEDGQQPLLTRTELCARLSPPPIPPWLLESPDRLRHLVMNCSSWRRYIDLCSIQNPEYPHALAEHGDSGNVAIQWIPFIIVMFLGILIVVAVAVMYTLYRTKRMNLDFFAEYHKYRHHSQNYCDQGSYISPSVTVESQLSVCALEDDSFAAIIPSHIVYRDLANNRGNIVRSPGMSARGAANSGYDSPPCQSLVSREIILHPDRLSDDDLQSPLYVSDMAGSDYYSSHSLPIDSDNEKIETRSRSKHKRSKSTRPASTISKELNDNDYESPYVQIHRAKSVGSPSFSRSSQRSSKSAVYAQPSKRDSMRGIVQRCRKAGASLVHGMIWNRAHGQDHNSSDPSKSSISFGKLRQSIHNVRLSRHKPCRKSETSENEAVSPTTAQLVSPVPETAHDPSLSCPTQPETSSEAQGKDTRERIANDPSSVGRGKFKNLGNLLRYVPRVRMKGDENKESRKSRTSVQTPNHDQTFTYVNEAFEGNDSEAKVRRSPFRKMKMPSVLRKINRNRENN